MISKVLEIISTIIFLIAGVASITKYSLKPRVRIYLELFFTVANFLWMICCIILHQDWYAWVAVMYIILGFIGIFNFRKIYRKERKKVVGFKLPENYYSCKKFNTEYEWCDCDDCKKERDED